MYIRMISPRRNYQFAGKLLEIRPVTIQRHLLHFLRKQNRKNISVELKQEHEPVIEAEALQQMTAQQIQYMLQHLPATTRAVFNLYLTEGYNHKEIGELLKISEGTSRWHLSEARKYLINLLKAKERA